MVYNNGVIMKKKRKKLSLVTTDTRGISCRKVYAARMVYLFSYRGYKYACAYTVAASSATRFVIVVIDCSEYFAVLISAGRNAFCSFTAITFLISF